MDTIPDEIVAKIQSNPIQYANTVSIEELEKIIEISNNMYYNFGSSPLGDLEYDLLYDILKKRNPKCCVLQDPGHDITISEAKKIDLPHYMGSMDKVKPGSKELVTFLEKYKKPYVLSDKIDGVSLMVVYNSEGTFLYTRGNGCVGQDISHLVPILKLPNLSHVFEKEGDIKQISVRGELVVFKDKFIKLGVDSNARNYVAGVISRKHISKTDMDSIHFLGYEIVEPRHTSSEQFRIMEEMGFEIPWYMVMNISMTETRLVNLLKIRKEKSVYDIDGIIITHDGLYPSNVAGNPKQSKAFKMILEEQMKETVVTSVEWNISRHKYLKPTIYIEPVNIGGANIRRTSGFNAKYILDNGIGPGARIIIIRSGDVIPHIHQVLHSVKPEMPTVEYTLNETGIDAIALGENMGKEHSIQHMKYFIEKLGIPKIGYGTLVKLYDMGYTNLTLLLHITDDELRKKKERKTGGESMIENIIGGIYTGITDVPTAKIMAATNIFGRGMGETKIQLVLDKIPDVLDLPANDELKHRIIHEVDMYHEKTAGVFVNHLDEFRTFLDTHPMIKVSNSKKKVQHKKVIQEVKQTSLYSGQKILCTGGKPVGFDEALDKHGMIQATSVSKKLDILVVKKKVDDVSEASGKYKKAMALIQEGVKDIRIIDHSEFQKEFL